jgi:hypothetical protein
MSLPEVLLNPDHRQAVVADCVALVDEEVRKKKGVVGLMIGGGYKVVRSLDGGKMVPKLVFDLLPEFAAAFEPFHADFRSRETPKTFVEFASPKAADLAEALLAITDGKAKHAKNAVLKKVYENLRPTAKRNIEEAMPGICRVVDKHAAKA